MDFLEILFDAFLDTLKLLPFILAIHILIEIFEYKASSRISFSKILKGPAAPAIAGATGLIPQCGFSVIATKLYSSGSIAIGTLFAVYIATSDEAVPILLSNPDAAIKLVPLLIIKFALALIAGYAINLIFKNRSMTGASEQQQISLGTGCHGHGIGHDHSACGHDNCNADKNTKFNLWNFLEHPLLHTLTIVGFIFLVNLILGVIIGFIGEETLEAFLQSAFFAQPFIAALVGLIPNCAASVVITQLYAVGSLSLGATVAGLSVNAGIAFAVLFKINKNLKQNLLIVGSLYLISVAAGVLVSAITLLIL